MRNNKGFTLLELLIVVVILGVLALIAAPTLLSAADKAKEGAVKANVSAASSTIMTRLAVEGEDAADAVAAALPDLNGTTSGDLVCSPFAGLDDAGTACTAVAFAAGAAGSGSAGQTTMTNDADVYTVTIAGEGKSDDDIIAQKTVTAPQD